MGLFEQFPYANFHEMNLDWLLRKVRALDAKTEKQAEQIAALEDWISGANLETLIDERLTEMLNNGAFDDIVAQALGVVITPQLLGYPDTKTADEVFTTMLDYTVNPIAIPAGTYNLTQTYRLNNVIDDQGTYTNCVPLYKREKAFDLMGFSIAARVDLPLKDSYIEGAAYLNGFWYVGVYCYNETYDQLIKYDEAFNQILTKNLTRPDADAYSAHAIRNVYTDGTYIYVDFTRSTRKLAASDMSVLEITDHVQVMTDYFNGEFWGIAVSGSVLQISRLKDDFTVAETFTVDRQEAFSGIQNCTFHNGLIYIPSLPDEHTTVVDMYDWSYENIYYSDQMEIEKISFKDGVAQFFGHSIGITGAFQSGPYNGGTPTKYVGLYSVDGDTQGFNLSVVNKFGVYDFENVQIGVFGNSGKLFIFDDVIYAKVGRYLAVRTPGGGWRLCGADSLVSVEIASGIYVRIMPDGSVNIWLYNYTLDTSTISTNITVDLNNVFDMLGLTASANRMGYVFGRGASNADPNVNFGGAQVYVTRTLLQLRPFILKGSGNLLLNGSFTLIE